MALGFLGGFWDQLSSGQATLIQTLVIAVGGVWAFLRYRTRRESQPIVTIAPAWRITRRPGQDTVLILSVRITNSSTVLLRGLFATATVFDASEVDADKNVIRQTWAVRDLLADPKTDPPADSTATGSPKPPKEEPNLIEPGEVIDTEVAVFLHEVPPRLLNAEILVDVPRGVWSTVWAYIRHPRLYPIVKPERLYWSWSAVFFIEIEPPPNPHREGWLRRLLGTPKS